MKKWLENRPRGFGEGKVYDTSIEDKLMEEIEQNRKAQLANINNLKNNNTVNSNSKKQQGQQGKGNAVSEDSKHGIRVRLVNLPKKKNIHRDLQSAFKGVPGIVDIVPVVSGNKRTKDPICKGIASIDFKSENEAYRFVQTFSGQSITFGKVQKQIKCDMNSSLLTEHEETSYNAQRGVPSLDFQAEKISTNVESESEVHKSTQILDDEERLGDNQSPLLPESICEDGPEERGKSAKKEFRGKGKKITSKANKERVPKINVPGSANRLKIREKAVLAGVFSKYAANTSKMTAQMIDNDAD
ncbi:hypothetical protein ACH5RR_035680 [Cinchona calisaya]|uniref:RRM domain-containing protein n=1 Tax=Cinchona calisaya TaxID=153742 RepID=A0ABD2Y0X9_9GENT